MCYKKNIVFGFILLYLVTVSQACDVLARIESGLICGAQRWDERGEPYASFRGVPYAKQPMGELRFKELQPLEPFDYILDATEEGPICPQKNIVFEELMRPKGMSEACISANIHTPLYALPGSKTTSKPLPILVVIHGGSLFCGSGDSDMYGPEYLITKGIVVITFNYRLNVFGFLSLNSPEIPGNQGLRDAVTLLRWVQRNAKAFGGDPDDVTLLGYGAGATMAHLLTLSTAAEGLFKKVVLMSGTAIQTTYTLSSDYAQKAASSLLKALGITSADPAEIHRQLVATPLDRILSADWYHETGLAYFNPVVETSFPDVTTIIEEQPELLIIRGVGKQIPVLIGFNDMEMFSYEHVFKNNKIVKAIKDDITMLVPNLIHKLCKEDATKAAKKIKDKYFKGDITLKKYMEYATDSYTVYPALKLAQWRAEVGGASAFVYRFSYQAIHSIIKDTYNLTYKGSGHAEDLTYVFRTNSALGTHRSFPEADKDDEMREWMTRIISNFIYCSHPSCNDYVAGYEVWPAASATDVDSLHYQDIRRPRNYRYPEATLKEKAMIRFFDSLLL